MGSYQLLSLRLTMKYNIDGNKIGIYNSIIVLNVMYIL